MVRGVEVLTSYSLISVVIDLSDSALSIMLRMLCGWHSRLMSWRRRETETSKGHLYIREVNGAVAYGDYYSRRMGNSLLKATIVDVQVWFTVVTSVGREVRLGIDTYARG